MNEDKHKIISYRIDRATQSIKDAKILFKNESLNSCINRIYYALFYVISALLLRDGVTPSKHTGVKSIFFKNYIKTNVFEKEMEKFYTLIFDYRQMGDYADLVSFNKNDVDDWLKNAEKYVDEIKAYTLKEL